jgi:hypothetical protein
MTARFPDAVLQPALTLHRAMASYSLGVAFLFPKLAENMKWAVRAEEY